MAPDMDLMDWGQQLFSDHAAYCRCRLHDMVSYCLFRQHDDNKQVDWLKTTRQEGEQTDI